MAVRAASVCALVCALALCLGAAAQDVERWGNGVAQVDTFSMLDNDRVDVLKWSALEFGAATVDFREARVSSEVELSIPGGIQFTSESVSIGGAGSGPLTVSSDTNDIQLVSNELLSVRAKQQMSVRASGTEVNLDALQDTVLRSRSVVKLHGGQLDVVGSGVGGVALTALETPVSVRAGTKGVGRTSAIGDTVTLSGPSGITVVTAKDFEAAAGRNLDATGDTISLTAQNEIDVAAPLGDVYVAAGSNLQVFGETGALRGDSGVLLRSITSDVTLTSTFDSEMKIEAGDAVQIQAVNRGLTLSAVTGNVVMSAPDTVEMSTQGNTTLSSTDVTVTTEGTVNVYAQGEGGVVVSQSDEIVINAGEDFLAQGLSIDVNAGTFVAVAEQVQLYGRQLLEFTAGKDLEAIILQDTKVKHRDEARFYADTDLLLESIAGDVLFDAGRDLKFEARAGDGLVEATAGTVVLNGEESSVLQAQNGQVFVEVKSRSTLTSGDDVFLASGGEVALASSRRVVVSAQDDMTLTGGAWYANVGGALSVSGEEDVEFKQTAGDDFTVRATAVNADARTVVFGPTDRLVFHANGANGVAALRGNSLLDFDFENDIEISSGRDIDVTGGRQAWVSAGELLSLTAANNLEVSGTTLVVNARTAVVAEAADVLIDSRTLVVEAFRGYRSVAGDAQVVDTTGITTYHAKGVLAMGSLGAETSMVGSQGVSSESEQLKIDSSDYYRVTANAGNAEVVGDRDWFLTAESLAVSGGNVEVTATEATKFAAVGGIAMSALQSVVATTENGDDYTVQSGDDVWFTAGDDLAADGEQLVVAFVEGGAVSAGGDVTVRATSTYQHMRAERRFDNVAVRDVIFNGAEIDIVGTEEIEVIGGRIAVKNLDANEDIIIEADGGGSRWKTFRFPDKEPVKYGDIEMLAGVDVLMSAGRNLTLETFDGYWRGVSQADAGVRGGIVTFRSGEGKHIRFDGEGASGVFLGTLNEEDAHIYGGNYTHIDTTTSVLLRSFGRDSITGAGIEFQATSGGDFCYTTDATNDGLLVDGFRGVFISATGSGADVEVTSFKGTTVDAERTIEVRSDGWSFDPLGVVGLDFPLGVLFRTNAVNTDSGLGEGDIVVEAEEAGVLMHGLTGATWDATAGIVEVFGSDEVDLRATDYLANVNLLAEGDVDVEASNKIYARAGSSSSDGDLRLNATKTASIDAVVGDISFVQLGSSADAVRSGVRIAGEKGDVLIRAEDTVTFDASVGNGRVDIRAETGDIDFATTDTLGSLLIHAIKAEVRIQGQTSANFTADNKVQVTSAEKLDISSGGLANLELSASAVEFQADTFELDTLKDITMTFSDISTDSDFFRAAAGGSLTVAAETDLEVTAEKDLHVFGDGEVNIDGPANILVTGDQINFSLGGDKATTGLDIDAIGGISVESKTDDVLIAGDFVDMKSGDVFTLAAVRDVIFDSRGEFGRGLLWQSESSDVFIIGFDQVEMSANEEMLLRSSNGQIFINANHTEVAAARELDLFAPKDAINVVTDALENRHLDFVIESADTFALTLGTASLLVEADAKLAFEAGQSMLFQSLIADITVNSTQDDAPITFETRDEQSFIRLNPTLLGVFSAGLGIDIDGQDGVTLDVLNTMLFNASDALVVNAGNDVEITAVDLVSVATKQQLGLVSGGTLSLYAPGGPVTATAIDSLILSADGDVLFDDNAVDPAGLTVAAAEGSVQWAAADDIEVTAGEEMTLTAQAIYFKSSGGRRGKDASGLSILANGVGTGLTLEAGDDLLVYGEEGVAIAADELFDLDVAQGATLFSAAGDEGITIRQPAGVANPMQLLIDDDLSVTSLHEVVFDAGNTVDVFATLGVSFLSRADEGDIGIRSPGGAITVDLADKLSFTASHEGAGHGVLTLTSTTHSYSAGTGMTLSAGGDIGITAETVSALADSPATIAGRNQVIVSGNDVSFFDATNLIVSAVEDQGLIAVEAPLVEMDVSSGAGLSIMASGDLELKSASDIVIGRDDPMSIVAATISSADTTSIEAYESSVFVSGTSYGTSATEIEISGGQAVLLNGGTLALTTTQGQTNFVGERAHFDNVDFAVTTLLDVESLNDMTFRATTGSITTDTGLAARLVTTRDQLLYAHEGAVTLGAAQVVAVQAAHNLGPIGGLIAAKEYNPIAAEFLVFNGPLTVNTVGQARLATNGGDVVFGSEELICYGSTNVGWFDTSAPRSTTMGMVTTDACSVGNAMTCPQLTEFITSMRQAFAAYNLKPF